MEMFKCVLNIFKSNQCRRAHEMVIIACVAGPLVTVHKNGAFLYVSLSFTHFLSASLHTDFIFKKKKPYRLSCNVPVLCWPFTCT